MTVFNPLDMANLGNSIANALLEKEPVPLGTHTRFPGAGVYAIYYTGPLALYGLAAEANAEGKWAQPIYVGKAVPAGARKGVLVSTATTALSARLNEHAGSVKAATNLDIADFHCRWLVTEQIWIPLGESLMIARFAPVWNSIVDGFGNHDPGAGRHAGKVSRWDVLHPGRAWAHKFAPRNETAGDIGLEVSEYLRQRLQV